MRIKTVQINKNLTCETCSVETHINQPSFRLLTYITYLGGLTYLCSENRTTTICGNNDR
jgi:hypothetical protein